MSFRVHSQSGRRDNSRTHDGRQILGQRYIPHTVHTPQLRGNSLQRSISGVAGNDFARTLLQIFRRHPMSKLRCLKRASSVHDDVLQQTSSPIGELPAPASASVLQRLQSAAQKVLPTDSHHVETWPHVRGAVQAENQLTHEQTARLRNEC